MDLQNRIVKIVDYFRGLDIKGGLYIVKVEYPEKWGAIQDDKGFIKVAKSETAINEYFYYGKLEETNIDDIFDLVEATILMNQSVEAKINLMREKVEELKALFSSHSLDELRQLKFVLEEKKKRQVKPRTKAKDKKTDKPKRKYTRKPKIVTDLPEENNTDIKAEENILILC